MKHITNIVQEVVIESVSLFMADPERKPQTIHHIPPISINTTR